MKKFTIIGIAVLVASLVTYAFLVKPITPGGRTPVDSSVNYLSYASSTSDRGVIKSGLTFLHCIVAMGTSSEVTRIGIYDAATVATFAEADKIGTTTITTIGSICYDIWLDDGLAVYQDGGDIPLLFTYY